MINSYGTRRWPGCQRNTRANTKLLRGRVNMRGGNAHRSCPHSRINLRVAPQKYCEATYIDYIVAFSYSSHNQMLIYSARSVSMWTSPKHISTLRHNPRTPSLRFSFTSLFEPLHPQHPAPHPWLQHSIEWAQGPILKFALGTFKSRVAR